HAPAYAAAAGPAVSGATLVRGWRRASLAARCFFFQAEDGIRDFHVTGVQTLLFRSAWASNGYGQRVNAGGGKVGSVDAQPYSIKIGRASCRERVEVAVVGGAVQTIADVRGSGCGADERRPGGNDCDARFAPWLSTRT